MTTDATQRENRSSAASRSDLKIMANDIAYMRQDVLDIKSNLNNTYVTKDQFDPIKKLVYGLVGLILTAVVISIMTLLITGKASTRFTELTPAPATPTNTVAK
jgi:hypothetical protein